MAFYALPLRIILEGQQQVPAGENVITDGLPTSASKLTR
jgi:hypothetical protein